MATTYARLQAEVVSYLRDQSASPLGNELPVLIRRAEEELNRMIRPRAWFVSTSGTLAAGATELATPEGCVDARKLAVYAGAVWRHLEKRPLEYLENFWPGHGATTATPRFYADLGSVLRIAGTPAAELPYRLAYTRKPKLLSDGEPVNWWAEHGENALFWATCKHAAEFRGQMAERHALYKSNMLEALDQIGRTEDLSRVQPDRVG